MGQLPGKPLSTGRNYRRSRKFLGTSENAVRIQITVALIAYLLLRIAKAAQTAIKSPLAFARLVRSNLMHFKAISDLATPEPSPLKATTDQLQLALY